MADESRYRKTMGLVIVIFGFPGIVLLGLMVLGPYLHSASLGEAEAEARIRQVLRREIIGVHLPRDSAGVPSIPDAGAAAKLAAAFAALKRLEFGSIRVASPIPDLLFPERPNFVVRVTAAERSGRPDVRYFWLGWDGFDREISWIAWALSI